MTPQIGTLAGLLATGLLLSGCSAATPSNASVAITQTVATKPAPTAANTDAVTATPRYATLSETCPKIFDLLTVASSKEESTPDGSNWIALADGVDELVRRLSPSDATSITTLTTAARTYGEVYGGDGSLAGVQKVSDAQAELDDQTRTVAEVCKAAGSAFPGWS